ncbi:MAG: response regulator [Anaerolineae bacterium]|nr:response regulator [Anaerolineae bacterium]
MSSTKERIFIIDPVDHEREMLAQATLEPFGYEVQTTGDGAEGLTMILEDPPDLLVLDLHPESLSGADVLAALSAQAVDLPVVILADIGAEKEALHAFRLGAKDYVVRPLREAEMIQVIERIMRDIRVRRDREMLVGEVRQASNEADQRLRELKTLMSIGKTVTFARSLDELFDRVVRAAIQLTRAESVGFFLRDEASGALILRAGQNLSRNLLDRMGQPVEDELASVVMSSGETFIQGGEALTQFRPAQQGATAVIYAPLVVQDKPIGLLWVANSRLEFAPHMKDVMTALADYAAIAVVNTRLLAMSRSRPEQEPQPVVEPPRSADTDRMAIDPELVGSLRATLTHLMGNMNLFRTGEMGELPPSHQAAVDVMHREFEEAVAHLDELIPQE